MNKINVKDINIESCEMVIDKRHYKVVEHHLVNHSRKVFYDDKNYYKIFDKEYCHRKNFIKAYESGFFDELAPALKALIMDGDEVVGYVTEVGERISKSPYTPIPKAFYEKVLNASKEKIAGQIFNVGADKQNYKIGDLAEEVAKSIDVNCTLELGDNKDHRSYFTSFKKIQDVLSFSPKFDVAYGAKEMFTALENHEINDSLETFTLKWYKHIMSDEHLSKEFSIDGKLL